jgi:hypothetical protein
MNFKPLSDLYAMVSTQAPGYNEDSAIDELLRTARTFCRESLVSQETVETSIDANARTLVVDSPASQVAVHRVMWVTAPYGDIAIVTLAELNQCAGWRTATGNPYRCANELDGELVLDRAPESAVTPVYVRVATIPKLVQVRVDAILVDEWGEAIADGALYRILRMPNQTWSNPGAAAEAKARYEIELSRAKAEAAKNRSVAVLRQRVPRYC